jgi:hypothetical protein
MTYTRYLEEIKKDKKIRLVSRASFIVYKSKFWWYRKAIDYLKKYQTIKRATRAWVFKSDINKVWFDSKKWLSIEVIANKYLISTRSVYRYIKIYEQKTKNWQISNWNWG